MNRIRIGLVGLVVASLTGLTAGGASAASVSGRGTASSSITLLSVDLGNIQHLKVLTDQGQGTLDAARLGLSGPQAFASLSAVDASGLLNLSLPNPAMKASAPGTSNASLAPMSVNFPGSAVSVAGTSLPIGAGLLASGTINPVKLEAHQSDTSVDSVVGTSVPDLSILQGLIDIKGVNVAGLNTNASVSASKGDTGIVGIDSVEVLSLQGLLGGLGLNLADLPLGTLTGILDQLGLKVDTGSLGLGNLTGGDISGVLGTATGLVTSLTNLAGVTDCSGLTSATSNLTGLLGLGDLLGSTTGILGGLLAPLNLPVSGIGGLLSACSVGNLTSTVSSVSGILTNALNGLKPTANGVLGDLLGTLTGAPLIQLSGVSLSAVANAADTLAHSSATTSANFGHIMVGGKDLGVLDLNAAVDQINALKGSVLGLVNQVTSTLGLGNLIDIGLLERTASTKIEGSYNVASAGLDLLRVSINPPANLGGLLQTVTANPVSGLLGSLGGVVPADTGLATNALAQAFGLTSLLTQPTTIKVGSIGADADYTSAVAGETLAQTPASGAAGGSGTLPRTGGTNGAWFAALAAISLAGAFGITRTLRKSPAPQSNSEDL
ncbi:MAG TPA: LPXTG cell wall anchor domain-containing protein [Acidimicrobiia bacterium]|nr:LPXTG cell wall anchor domain-containing protein [Acidimicrobiia bacterium]